jgi:hypothetical protein
VADRIQIPCIYVLAGANGAGKSSVAGAMFSAKGTPYFNPDDATRLILSANPKITLAQANSEAWYQGKRLLERAIGERLTFALETTLGGKTITALLDTALLAGIGVRSGTWACVAPNCTSRASARGSSREATIFPRRPFVRGSIAAGST